MTSTNTKIAIAFVLVSAVICATAQAQTPTKATPAEEKAQPLNLDSSAIASDMSKQIPVRTPTDTLSSGTNKVDDIFKQAEKHRGPPTQTELMTAGAPERVTKVTGEDGSYCVYSPSVARTDGIDAIQKGLQSQVRSCPQ